MRSVFPRSVVAAMADGSLVEGHPLCQTEEEVAKAGLHPDVPQILPLGGGKKQLFAGEEVERRAAQMAADGDAWVGSFDPNDPEVKQARSLPGYYVDVETSTTDSDTLFHGVKIDEEWLGWPVDENDPEGRTYKDDWLDYMRLIDQGILEPPMKRKLSNEFEKSVSGTENLEIFESQPGDCRNNSEALESRLLSRERGRTGLDVGKGVGAVVRLGYDAA